MTFDTEVFVGAFKHWREIRGLSQSTLAAKMSYTRSYVSKVESGSERPSLDFARSADQFLQAGGAIRRAYREAEQASAYAPARDHEFSAPEVQGPALVVEHDDAELAFDGSSYTAFQRRQIRNIGTEPITRYLVRIAVDRFPGSPERSMSCTAPTRSRGRSSNSKRGTTTTSHSPGPCATTEMPSRRFGSNSRMSTASFRSIQANLVGSTTDTA